MSTLLTTLRIRLPARVLALRFFLVCVFALTALPTANAGTCCDPLLPLGECIADILTVTRFPNGFPNSC